MGVSLTYLKLEIKRAGRILPYFLAGAIVLALLLGTIAFLSGKVLYGKTAVGRIAVGVVLPEDDKVAEKALSMLGSMDSVKGLCDFTYVSDQKGRSGLSDGTFYALMVIPEGFIQNIMDGTNTPATLIMPDQAGIEALIFRDLADAGAGTLGVAQAAIYAADEFCAINGLAASVPEVEQKLNQIYLSYSMVREGYFRDYQVSAAGDVSVISYYGISMAVLFLLLCGIPAFAILRPDSLILQRKLRMIGIGRAKSIAARIVSVSLLLTVAMILLAGAAGAWKVFRVTWQMIPVALLFCMVSAAMIVFIYEIAGSPTSGVIFLFLSVVGMMFISGGFVPAVFLPEGVQKLALFMPTTLLMKVLKGFVTGEILWTSVAGMCLMGVGFYGACLPVRRFHE